MVMRDQRQLYLRHPSDHTDTFAFSNMVRPRQEVNLPPLQRQSSHEFPNFHGPNLEPSQALLNCNRPL